MEHSHITDKKVVSNLNVEIGLGCILLYVSQDVHLNRVNIMYYCEKVEGTIEDVHTTHRGPPWTEEAVSLSVTSLS